MLSSRVRSACIRDGRRIAGLMVMLVWALCPLSRGLARSSSAMSPCSPSMARFIAGSLGRGDVLDSDAFREGDAKAMLERIQKLVGNDAFQRTRLNSLDELIAAVPFVFATKDNHIYAVLSAGDDMGRKKLQVWAGKKPYLIECEAKLLSTSIRDVYRLLPSSRGFVRKLAGQPVRIESPVSTIGILGPADSVSCDIKITNLGDTPLVIDDLRVSCKCSTPEIVGSRRLARDASCVVRTVLTPSSESGIQNEMFLLASRQTEDRSLVKDVCSLIVVGNRIKGATIYPGYLNFGTMGPGSAASQAVMVTESFSERIVTKGAELVGLQGALSLRKKTVRGRRATCIRVTLEGSRLPPGDTQGSLRIETDSRKRPEIIVPILVRRLDELRCRPSVISFGVVQRGFRGNAEVDLHGPGDVVNALEVHSAPANCGAKMAETGNGRRLQVSARLDKAGFWKDDIVLKGSGGIEITVPCRAFVTAP